MQGMRPSWLCLQFKAVIHCVWGKSRISLGRVILLVRASGIFAAVEMVFVGIDLLRLVPGTLQQRLAAFNHCCTHCYPKCSAKMIQQVWKKMQFGE